MPTWDARQYLRFADERTRPCRDLAARIAVDTPARVIDLGCGPGNSTAVLAGRWPMAEISGIDNSPAMIAAARAADPSRQWAVADIAKWPPPDIKPFDVIFSNAALQWVNDHAAIFPKLLSHLAPGGALALQMPGNYDSPAHRIMRELTLDPAWRQHFPAAGVREWHVHDLPRYYDILSPGAAALDFWETEYLHVLPDAESIVEWYKGTGLRPFLDALPTDQLRAEYLAHYLDRLRRFYPTRADGRVLFPFRRLFIIAYAPAA